MSATTWRFLATVVRVIDGDTVIVDMDLGFYVRVRLSCRLAGVNAIELAAPGGREAREHLATLLPEGASVVIDSVKVDKYAGRFDGRIVLADGVDVATKVLAAGYAVRWDGRGKAPVPPWPIPTGAPA